MAVTARPEISKILLDLGIEPVDVYAVDNAEQTYLSALREGINTIEVASKDKKGDERSRMLRAEIKRIREKRRKVNVDKLFARKQVIPTNRIKPQALLPASKDDEKKGGMDEKTNSILDSIIGILRIGNKQDKKEATIEKKEREARKRKVRENLVESTRGIATTGKKLQNTIVSPFANILNAIGNFLKFIVAGYLINVVLNWFTDPENKKKIATLGRFFKDWWPALLAGALAFLTPLGLVIGGLIGFLSTALPALVALSKNPLLVGAALFTAGGIAPALVPGLVNDEADTAVDESVDQIGIDATIDQLGEQQESRNIFQRIGDFVTGAGAEREEQMQKLETGEEKRYGFFGEIKPEKMNKGGTVPGSGNKDTVPAMLTPGEFVMTKGAVQKYGINTLAGMNSSAKGTNIMGAYKNGGLVQHFNRGGLAQHFNGGGLVQHFNGGGLVGDLKDMVKDTDNSSKFIPAKAVGLVSIEVPVGGKIEKTIILPEKRISKPEDETPTKMGSKVIPDIMIVNSSTYRAMTTRSLGIHDLVGA